MIMAKRIEAEGEYFICPYCGSKIRIDLDIFSDRFVDDEAEVYWEECDRSFDAEREVTANYCSIGKIIYDKEQY